MSALIEAEIRAWIECSRCGRIEKPPILIRLPGKFAFGVTEKVCMTCEQCQGHAVMVLERAVKRLH